MVRCDGCRTELTGGADTYGPYPLNLCLECFHSDLRQTVTTVRCDDCMGSGKDACGECDGSGKCHCSCGHCHECRTCEGSGEEKCSRCEGNGVVERENALVAA
jgi:hypothetical protein